MIILTVASIQQWIFFLQCTYEFLNEWRNMIYTLELQSTNPYYETLLRTTKHYSVLQSTTPYYKLLLRTTKYYILQS